MNPSRPRNALLSIFLIVAVDILGFTLVLPLLPFYAERYGASPQVVGLLVTVFALCQLLSGPVLGRLSDSIGRKPMLIFSQMGTCLGFIILASANSLWLIFLSRLIDGATAGNLSIAQAYISDVTEPENRAKAFGVIGIAFGLGFLIGPGISGFLSQYGYHYPAWAAAGLSFTSILCSYFLLPARDPSAAVIQEKAETSENSAKSRRRSFFDGLFNWSLYGKYFSQFNLRPLLLQFLCFGLSFSAFTAGLALFAERRLTYHGVAFGPREVGYVYTYAGLLGLVIQGFLLGRLVKKLGEAKLALLGFLSQAIGYAGLAFVHTIPELLVAATVSSFGSGVLRPAITSLITQRVSKREQGTVLGVNQSLASIAQVAAPTLAGYLIDRSWLGAWAFASGGFALCGFFFALADQRAPKTAAEPLRA